MLGVFAFMRRQTDEPSRIEKLKATWQFFKHGLPWNVRRIPNGIQFKAKADTPFVWTSSQENNPQWQMHGLFKNFVEQGFNRNALIYAAIMYKARSKTTAPLTAYIGDPRKPERLPPEHPLSKLVARPNPHQSWAEFEMLNEIYFNFGNSFILNIRPRGGGLPTALYSLRPDRVTIVPSDKGGIMGYLYIPEGKAAQNGLAILPADMMHVKLPDPSDPFEGLGWGMPPLAIGQSGDVDNAITRFLKLFFQRGAAPLGLLVSDDPLTSEDIAFVRKRWMDIYGGSDKWVEPAVLGKGFKYQRVGATFKEMGFGEIDARNETRLLMAFGVPPILIGSLTGLNRSTYSNYGQALQAYWQDTALPELRLFEAEYQYYLQSDDGAFVAFDLSRVPALQKDVPKLTDAAFKMWQMGTPANMANEAAGLDVGDIPGGDIGYIASNLVPSGINLSDPEQSMEGAVDAEADTRAKTLRNPWLEIGRGQEMARKHHPEFAEIKCPLCDHVGVDLYKDHAGLCVCRGCDCTFDPQIHLKGAAWAINGK